MSSYKKETKNPKTGEWELADWVDDYFGPHKYGVSFPSEPYTYYNPEFVDLETRVSITGTAGASGYFKMTDHVTTSELSIKLKEAGIEQESYFSWVFTRGQKTELWDKTMLSDYQIPGDEVLASAFTISELGKMIHSALEDMYERDMPEHLRLNTSKKAFDVNYWGEVALFLKQKNLI